MATLDVSTSNLHLLQIEKYWMLVAMALTEIFKGESETVRVLERAINNLDIQEQFLFYHTEPLYIAADLAKWTEGEPELSERQITLYRSLIDRTGWQLPGLP